jgi:hypothetical protein
MEENTKLLEEIRNILRSIDAREDSNEVFAESS